jgi:hypothetical protein
MGAIAALAGAPAALADGTETLGAPSVPIGVGTDVKMVGVGTQAFLNAPTTLNADVPADAIVKQVLVYWMGQVRWPDFQPDTSISLNGNAVSGTLIGGPTNFFFAEDFYTYRADVTSLNLVKPGANAITVSDMNFQTRFIDPTGNDGVGLAIIYDDGTPSTFVGLRDGQDMAFVDFDAPLNATVPQTFSFTAAPVDRNARLGVLAGSVSGPDLEGLRGNVISGEFSNGTTFSIVNGLGSNQGDEFDAENFPITVPAGATSLTVQLHSQGGDKPASLGWIASTLNTDEPPPPPPGGQGCTPGYWKNHTEAWPPTGYSPNQALSTVFSPTGLGALSTNTLLQALKYGGGSTLEAKKKILLRAAVASLLNAAHPDVAFGGTPASIISEVNAALVSNDAGVIIALATELDELNNGGCPLN